MSPRKEPRDPVNENIGSGTGIGTFTPIYMEMFNENEIQARKVSLEKEA